MLIINHCTEKINYKQKTNSYWGSQVKNQFQRKVHQQIKLCHALGNQLCKQNKQFRKCQEMPLSLCVCACVRVCMEGAGGVNLNAYNTLSSFSHFSRSCFRPCWRTGLQSSRDSNLLSWPWSNRIPKYWSKGEVWPGCVGTLWKRRMVSGVRRIPCEGKIQILVGTNV